MQMTEDKKYRYVNKFYHSSEGTKLDPKIEINFNRLEWGEWKGKWEKAFSMIDQWILIVW